MSLETLGRSPWVAAAGRADMSSSTAVVPTASSYASRECARKNVLFGAYGQDGLHALFFKGFRPSPILDDARFS